MKEILAEKQKLETPLDFDKVVENTEIVIADGDTLKKSQDLIAKEYSYFMEEGTRNKDVAYKDLCINEDEDQSKITTLVALYKDPENPKNSTVLGTIRLTFGDEKRNPPLEAMSLVDVVDKETRESRWPHEEAGHAIDISYVCELGRLVFSREVRKDLEIQFYVARALMQEITNHAKDNNAKLMIAILPSYVYEFAKRNNVLLTKLNTDKETILKDTQKAKEIRERYPIYWKNLNPSLYTVHFD